MKANKGKTGESSKLDHVKTQIIQSLSHPEADEGLYFRNFAQLHEEDERPMVMAKEQEIFDALNELVREGKVHLIGSGDDVVFMLNTEQAAPTV